MKQLRTIPFSDACRLVEDTGEAALEQLGEGPFLIEIPTQPPLGLGAVGTAHGGTALDTTVFDEGLLLGLRRSRTGPEATLYELAPQTTIGRSSRCGVYLEGEESVSKEHARFDRDAKGWSITDLHTTNGTYVSRQRLDAGGSRRLGVRRFSLRHAYAYLLIAYKGEGGLSLADFTPSEAVALASDQPLRLGRTSEAEITLRRNSVSKWHARFDPQGPRWSVTDTGSANGTFVNGVQLAEGEGKSLASWDALGFGPSSFALYLEPRALLEWLMEGGE